MESCIGLYQKIEGFECDQDDGYQRYHQNGICVKLRFKGLNEKPGLFKITTGTNTALGGTDVKYE